MQQTVKARYHQGKIEPLEPLELEDGDEVVITVTRPETPRVVEGETTPTFGAWKDLLDCEQFEKDVYESRGYP
jgi:predicted DNA-binding antitoxin AbrB/MazE fold protein